MTQRAFTRQPRVDPEGWVALRRAFFDFGSSAIGPEFAAATFRTTDIEGVIAQKSNAHHSSLRVNDVGDHVLDLDSPTGARLFTPPVCRSFLSAVRNGKMRTGYAGKGAGEVLPMPLGAWRTDDDYIRFAGWSFDPNEFGAADENSPAWVFVDSADLAIVLEELKHWRANLPAWDGETEPDPKVTYRNRWPFCFELIDDDLWVHPPTLPNFEVAKLRLVAGSSTAEGGDQRQLTGDPGRPELGATQYMREFIRRVEGSEVGPVLVSEAESLRDWYIDTFPEKQPPSVKTIKNRIRDAWGRATRK
jgi:hypothetical protein